MSDIAVFTVRPPLRCFAPLERNPELLCGELAWWKRRGASGDRCEFFCDAHRDSSDLPITGEVIFRRVSLSVDVLFAGASWYPTVAQIEALSRLEHAVVRAGGVLNLVTVTSAVGRSSPPALPPGGRGGRPRREG